MRRSLGGGLYREGDGFWFRPTVNGRRTWRRLASLSVGDARTEAAVLQSDHERSKLGLTRDPFRPALTSIRVMAPELPARILQRFGDLRPDQVTVTMCSEYGATRGATRSADIELAKLSVVLTKAVEAGVIPVNPIRTRGRHHVIKRHSRECMPADADELHSIARRLLPGAVGWQCLFAALTGCRTEELLALRMDAASRNDPGWVEGNYLYVRRSKGGQFPFVEITPELRALITAHRLWHDRVSPWWFPGQDLFRPLNRVALTHALARIDGPKRTAHGLRAYCVTVWRSRGESNEQVASRIGDKTAALIETTYGALPQCWAGGEALGWVPRDGQPAWAEWIPANVVAL